MHVLCDLLSFINASTLVCCHVTLLDFMNFIQISILSHELHYDSGCDWERVYMHEGDSSNTHSDLPCYCTSGKCCHHIISVKITTCSPDHLGVTQHIIVSAYQPTVVPPLHIHTWSSPSGKAASEEVPMEDNPDKYGDVSVYDNVQEQINVGNTYQVQA